MTVGCVSDEALAATSPPDKNFVPRRLFPYAGTFTIVLVRRARGKTRMIVRGLPDGTSVRNYDAIADRQYPLLS